MEQKVYWDGDEETSLYGKLVGYEFEDGEYLVVGEVVAERVHNGFWVCTKLSDSGHTKLVVIHIGNMSNISPTDYETKIAEFMVVWKGQSLDYAFDNLGCQASLRDTFTVFYNTFLKDNN